MKFSDVLSIDDSNKKHGFDFAQLT